MRGKTFAALLCLILALQCVFSPMASALEPIEAEEIPALYQEGGEIAEEKDEEIAEHIEDVLSAQKEQPDYALVGGASYYERAIIAYGRPTVGEEHDHTATGHRFAVEGTDAGGSRELTMQENWEEDPPESGNWVLVSSDIGKIAMPTADEIGRVPDKEFDGWYVYGGTGALEEDETMLDGTNLNTDTWNQDGRDALNDIPLEDLIANGEAELSEDGRLLVNESTAFELLNRLAISKFRQMNGAYPTYYSRWTFPLVGSWKASSKALATDAVFKKGENEKLTLYKYDEEATRTQTNDLTAKPFDPTAESQEYFIRVAEDVPRVSLDLTAFEPYLEFQHEYSELVADGTGDQGAYVLEYSRYKDIQLTANMETPVNITLNGQSVVAADGATVTYSLENDGRYYARHRVDETDTVYNWESNNSQEAPARSKWSYVDIPIEKSNDERSCNELVVTITAPDGKTTATYTFYIQRVKSPTVTLKAGNTPAGVIAREDDIHWVGKGNTAEENKANWLKYFETDRKMRSRLQDSLLHIYGHVYHPHDTDKSYDLNNGGILFYDGWFNKRAWASGDDLDLDLDPSAIVVYQNYHAVVPGFDISTSNGTIYSGELKRRILLNTPKIKDDGKPYTLLDALFPTTQGGKNYESAYYYETSEGSTLLPSDSSDGWHTIDTETMSLDLRDLLVLPGTYKIEYIFTDPYTGQKLNFTRPLVVLAIPGDVDMDGTTTVADAAALRYLVLGNRLGSNDMTDAQSLFAWRVCNVNKDTEINDADYNALYGGYRPLLSTQRVLTGSKNPISVSDYFYIPLSSFDTRYDRNADKGNGSVKLIEASYTGKQIAEDEEGTVGDGGAVGHSSVGESVTPNVISTQDGIQRGDVFWVEVKIGALGEGYDKISSLTGTLSYDSRYIRPATLEDLEKYDSIDEVDEANLTTYRQMASVDWTSADREKHTWASWAALINKYNLRDRADTVFAGTGRFELNLAAQPANKYETHFSKTITRFEELIKEETGNTGALCDMVFSVKLSDKDKTAADLSNGGTIMQIPFYMHTFPTKFAGQSMPLISLDFGMQDLVMVNDGARLFNEADLSSYYSVVLSTSAFSAQEEIYGDLTRNLRSDKFGYSTEPMYIKIASDNTPRVTLLNEAPSSKGQNAKYGVYYEHSNLPFQGEVDSRLLPPGLEFDGTNSIKGTPTQAGEYLFTIGAGYYRIVVEQQPLHIYPINASSYYGEGDYSGTQDYSNIFDTGRYVYDSAKLAYSLRYAYEPKDLISGTGSYASANFTFDASRATDEHPNDGSMENLAWLLTNGGRVKDCFFTNPKLSTSRTASSDVGKYGITVDIGREGSDFYAELQNYYFVLDTSKKASVEVVARPLVVVSLNFADGEEAEAQVKIPMPKIEDTDTPLRDRATAQLGGNMAQFSVSVAREGSPQPAADGSRRVIYNGLPVSFEKGMAFATDIIEITYTPTFVETQNDKDNRIRPKNFFVAENSTEKRDIAISAIELTGGSSKKNYTLVSEQQKAITEINAGYVSNVALQSLTIEKNWADVPLEITYGDPKGIEITGRLIANLRFGENNTVQAEYTTPEGFASRHLYVSLVTVAQAELERETLGQGKTIFFGGSGSSNISVTDTAFTKNAENGIVIPCFTASAKLPATSGEYCIRVAYMPDTVSGIVYKAQYSEPITVNKRTITLRVPEESHYYGELPQVEYSFNIQDLASDDQGKISGSTTVVNGVGTPKDLARALGYASEAAWAGKPTLTVIDNGSKVPTTLEEFKDESKKLKKTSQVTGVDFYIGLYGAEDSNYKFNYEQIRRNGSLTISEEFGMNFGRIEQRPIVVKKLPAMLGSVYADFYADKPENLLLKNMSYSTDDGVQFALPTAHTDESTTYWTSADNSVTTKMGLTGDTALVGDDKLAVICSLRVLNETTQWSSMADGYFNMKDASGNTVDERNALAIVREMRLSSVSTAAHNYRLVYANSDDASGVRPQDTKRYVGTRMSDGTIKYTEYTGSSGNTGPWEVAGEVKLTTRKMTAVEIIGAPRQTVKTHGDEFIPDGLTVRISFESNGSMYNKDIDLTAYPLDGMKLTADGKGELVYNAAAFARYGLGVTLERVGVNKPFVGDSKNCVTYTDHNGANIVVSGKRCASHTTVTSAEKNFTITVKKKTLTLIAVDQYRYYGENNYSTRFVPCVMSGGSPTSAGALYEYYFDISQLAKHEQSNVPASATKTDGGKKYGYGYVRAGASGMTATVNDALSSLSLLTAPTFETNARYDSPVVDGGRGGYALNLKGGSMANYDLQYTSGKIYVFSRPVTITRFYAGYTAEDATDRSIYTLLTETEAHTADRILPYRDLDYKPSSVPVFSGYEQSGNTYREKTLGNSDIQPGYSGGMINGWKWFELIGASGASGGTWMPNDDDAAKAIVPAYAMETFFLSGTGVIGSDNPAVSISISYGTITEDITRIPVRIFEANDRVKFVDNGSGAYGNYRLATPYSGNDLLPARVDLRSISDITVTRLPKSLDSYTYGEPLDMRDLQLMVRYESTDGSSDGKTRIVNYADDLSQYGIFINYYDKPNAPPAPTDGMTKEEKAAVVEEQAKVMNDYRRAASGDHLSIAPLHDSDSDSGAYKYNNFSQNGMYLIITAHRSEKQDYVQRMIAGVIGEEGKTAPGVQIKISPLEIEYEVEAEDKIYDGSTQAVGSVTFTNIYPNDLVYAATGRTDYEGVWKWSEKGGSAESKYVKLDNAIKANGYKFTSGSVTGTGRSSMLQFTDVRGWGKGTLTFEFADPNVRYENDAYSEVKTSNDETWDDWSTDVAPMRLSVRDIILGGPDAANYTFASDQTWQTSTSVALEADNAPKAKIEKATRAPLSKDTIGAMPTLEVDESTGVVRLCYHGSTVGDKVKSASVLENRNRVTHNGALKYGSLDLADKYADELHLEFAIEYLMEDSNDIRYYCGDEGAYWDTFYFGGETVTSVYPDGSFYPEGYVSEKREPGNFGGEMVGQEYKWTNVDARINPDAVYERAVTDDENNTTITEYKLIQYLDTDDSGAVVARNSVWELDDGLKFHVADINTEAKSTTINGETYYYFYGYYTTERSAIPRGAYVVGKVRLAETHNYLASDPLYSSEDYAGESTPDATKDALKAKTKEAMEAYAEYMKRPRNSDDAATIPGDMLRMFRYRIELIGAKDMRSADKDDENIYDVRTLRAVRFIDGTDTGFGERSELSGAVGDGSTHYYSGYYWDDRYQNALEFSEKDPIKLGTEIWLEVTREVDGESVTALESFNSGNTIQLFVTQGGGDYNPIERWIKIHPEELIARLGDTPIKLEVEFYPRRVANMEIVWESSDENIVKISEDGFIEFVGIGTAVITATSHFGRVSTMTVTVFKSYPEQTGVFNHELLAAYLGLDRDFFFYPEREMTRGEFVCVAAMFFIANDKWDRFSSGEFIDVVGDEPYAEAVKLLGEWGVINGVGEDQFAGERIATRAEAAAIIARMLGIDPSKFIGKDGFADSGIHSTWASGYINGLKAQGVVVGSGGDFFRPDRGITRAEAAVMFHRLANYKTAYPVVNYPKDVPMNHWAYSAILRAVNRSEPVFEDGTDRSTGKQKDE